MAETETPLKRPREETQVGEEEEIMEETKRQKPYHHILSILEAEEEDPPQDELSSLMETLQQELSSSSSSSNPTSPHHSYSHDPHLPLTITTHPLEDGTINGSSESSSSSSSSSSSPTSSSPLIFKDYEEEEEKGMSSSIIRHLLEASDDELGIPQTHIRLQSSENEDDDVIRVGGSGGLYFGGNTLNDVGGTGISLFGSVHDDGFWDFEDEAANYYTLLQSELFM